MTKYILHGGNAQKTCIENDLFFSEILKESSTSPKILLVHFAGRPEKAETNKTRDIAQFEKVKGIKNLKFEIANELTFVNQISNNDIIYLGGGTTGKLLATLKNYPALAAAFEGKTVAGESAGANVLATVCYSKAFGGVLEGLGILPIKTIPHYVAGLDKELETVYIDLEKVYLPECTYAIYNG